MKVYNKIGSRERFKEMFENINKVKLNESFDVPKKKDKEYLNKGGDKKAIDVQPNKYDDGVREPRERNIQVKDKSVEKIKGGDKPITEAGVGNYDAYNSPEWVEAKKDVFGDRSGDKIKRREERAKKY